MFVYKCKMCGGNLEISHNVGIYECEHCGTKQTLSRSDDPEIINLYNRANHYRINSDFDKAMSVYEKILNADPEDSEAYWSIVLCRYGIDYVEDSKTHKRIPTINRTQVTPVTADEDYKSALKYADEDRRKVYKQEASVIEEIQKNILEISNKEKPFDVFICYKETDENGKRTMDSTLAQDIYYQLTEQGHKVFFSRITLEDKSGTAYEPYIFSALNSARVMIAIGTKPGYLESAWVRNEWSRFLTLMKKDSTKVLIPCYRDMEAYDLPDELSLLPSYDMGKIGFIQDLIRGISKILIDDSKRDKPSEIKSQPSETDVIVELKRQFKVALEMEAWETAGELADKILELDPRNAEAYLYKIWVTYEAKNIDELFDSIINNYNYYHSKTITVTVVEPDRQHILDMAKRYTVKSYLKEREIEELYSTKPVVYEYSSCDPETSYKDMMVSFKKKFIHVMEFAEGNLKIWMEKAQNDFSERVKARLEDDKNKVELEIERIKENYKKNLKKIDEQAENLHKQALEEVRKDYDECCDRMAHAKTAQEYDSIAVDLDKVKDYFDTEKLVAVCKKKAKHRNIISGIFFSIVSILYLVFDPMPISAIYENCDNFVTGVLYIALPIIAYMALVSVLALLKIIDWGLVGYIVFVFLFSVVCNGVLFFFTFPDQWVSVILFNKIPQAIIGYILLRVIIEIAD